MSNAHETAHHGDGTPSNTSLAKNVAMVLGPILAVAGVVFYLVGAPSLQPGYSAPTISQDALDVAVGQRIQKIGSVSMGDTNRPVAGGEEVYKAQCAACHATGAAGAPKFQDAGAWSARIAQGLPTLINSALKGKNAMGAQGGGSYSDLEISRAVVYLANAGGAKFTEPAAPAASGAAAAAEPAASGAAGSAAPAPASTPVASASPAAVADAASLKVENGVVKMYFASGKADLAEGAKPALQTLVKSAAAGKKLVVSGYHDAKGNATANAELAKKRALAVRDVLTSLGVDKANIDLKKPTSLVGDGSNAEARRVEVQVQ
jgi:cytochrome c5